MEVSDLANIKSAKKRVVVNQKKTEQNKSIRSALRTDIKKIELLIKEGKVRHFGLCEISAETLKKAGTPKVPAF